MIRFAPNFEETKQASPVCFVPGPMGGGDDWIWMADSLGPAFRMRAVWDMNRLDVAMPEPAHVITHGAGAFAALRLAAAAPWRFRSLTLIDADIAHGLDGLLTEAARDPGQAMRQTARVQASEGDAAGAMATLVDFFSGVGAWKRSSVPLQRRMARKAGAMLETYAAQRVEPLSAHDLAGVVCPTLLISGAAANAETKAVHDTLLRTTPFASFFVLGEAGYAAHMTDPHKTHPAIRDFLVRVDKQWQDATASVRQAA